MKPTKCEICGAPEPTHRIHVIPKALYTGDRPEENLIFVCANCNAQMGRGLIRAFEFEQVLGDLLKRSGLYSEVITEPHLRRSDTALRQPDIYAKSADGKHRILIECKSLTTISEGRLRDVLTQIQGYRSASDPGEFVLAIAARLMPDQKALVRASGVEPWDLDEIASRFRAQIKDIHHPVLRRLLRAVSQLDQSAAPLSPEAALLSELRALPPGKLNWLTYQKLVSRILERLFCPPLSSPIIERFDETRVNRRDIILPNYAEHGFWAFVRGRYCADFIVVDAKNYAEPVGKHEALQMLNYLKDHGTGLLGIIVSRVGCDSGCETTIREHWMLHGKLVAVLTDVHLELMLRTKEAKGPPEEVLRQWIEDFRLAS